MTSSVRQIVVLSDNFVNRYVSPAEQVFVRAGLAFRPDANRTAVSGGTVEHSIRNGGSDHVCRRTCPTILPPVDAAPPQSRSKSRSRRHIPARVRYGPGTVCWSVAMR